jgi:hypothetical protein
LLIHQSRFGKIDAAVSDCALERWRERGRTEGVAAREKLREGVEAALLEPATHLEQVFFDYADRTASLALNNHLGISSAPWTTELISAWSRFIATIYFRHPDAMPELRAAVHETWNAAVLKLKRCMTQLKGQMTRSL